MTGPRDPEPDWPDELPEPRSMTIREAQDAWDPDFFNDLKREDES